MIAPACRKGLRRKNGRKANFRQVQTSAVRSFGSQSNQIINTASVRNARRFPHVIQISEATGPAEPELCPKSRKNESIHRIRKNIFGPCQA